MFWGLLTRKEMFTMSFWNFQYFGINYPLLFRFYILNLLWISLLRLIFIWNISISFWTLLKVSEWSSKLARFPVSLQSCGGSKSDLTLGKSTIFLANSGWEKPWKRKFRSEPWSKIVENWPKVDQKKL